MGKISNAPTVGIDIGSSLIKVVEARPGKGGVQITALGVAPTPSGVIDDNDVIVDPQTLGQAIRQLLGESGIKSKRCVSAVSGQSSVVVRIIEVPRMTRQELEETMKWEIERHVPFSANEILKDFEPIERPGAAADEQNMEVLLAVAQQDVVNSHVDALFAAGLDPVAIDVEPLAVCRSLIDLSKNGEKSKTVAIVNIGAETTDLGIFRDGILAFPRVIPLAGNAITRAISDAMNISLDEAEKLKREKAVVHVDMMALHAREAEPMGEPGSLRTDATVGLGAAPTEEETDYSDMGFIPGLGFAPTGESKEPEPPAPETGLDFDIDLGASSEASVGERAAFDLSEDKGEPPSPRPAFDLSEVSEEPEPTPQASDLPVPREGEVSDDELFNSLAPVLADIVAEVRRSIDYYVSRYQDQPAEILLCGGTAKIPNLDKYFEAEFGIPASVANPLKNTVVISRNLSQDYLNEVAPVFSVSVGLAVRDMIGE